MQKVTGKFREGKVGAGRFKQMHVGQVGACNGRWVNVGEGRCW